LPLPACEAVMVVVPAPLSVTVEPDTVATDVLLLA
jgi:hypothetical protein